MRLLVILCLIHLSGYSHGQTPSNKGQSNFTKTFKGEPGRAAFYSLVLPGGGQIYNKRYWKAPLIWAGEGYAIYNLTQKISSYKTLRNEHIRLLNEDPTNSSIGTIFRQKQSARYQREVAWIIVGAAHLLNIVEAFIDRHLILFDTSPDLTSQIIDPTWQYEPQLSIARITIPLNSKRP